MVGTSDLQELQLVCPGAAVLHESNLEYVYLPRLKLPAGCSPPEADGLLCLQGRDGYLTRLFLSAEVRGKGNNWKAHQILSRTWYVCSWNNVSSDLRPAQILAEHLRAFR